MASLPPTSTFIFPNSGDPNPPKFRNSPSNIANCSRPSTSLRLPASRSSAAHSLEAPLPTAFSYNSTIQRHLDAGGSPHAVLSIYADMLACGVLPDRHTLPRVLAASRLSGDFSCSKVVHGHAVKLGFASDGYVVTSLMAAYGQFDGVEAAERVFVEMRERNSVSWTLLAGLHAMEDRHESALRVFYRMVSSGAVVDSVFVGC